MIPLTLVYTMRLTSGLLGAIILDDRNGEFDWYIDDLINIDY